jgi:hypothetical protein
MKTWLTIFAIKLGFIKLICPEPSYDSITRYRMKKSGIRFKDIARAFYTNEVTISENLLKGCKTWRIQIDRFIKKQEKKK